MTQTERLKAVLEGREVDRVPVSVWMHMNEFDQDTRSLAEAMVEFNARYDYDFIKMMPFGAYTVPDWGAKLKIFCTKYQEVEIAAPGIGKVEDYLAMEPLAPTYGTWGRTLQLSQWLGRLLPQKGRGDVPYIQTLFSPATVLKKLAGNRLFADMVEHPEAVHYALEVVTETTIDFVKANIEAGVSGFFFATQLATTDLMTQEGFAEFCKPYDLRILNAYKDKTWFNVIHIHGEHIMFDTVSQYPCPVVNWHDRQDGPRMKEARERCGKVFLGGLREGPAIVDGRLVYDSVLARPGAAPALVEAHIHEALDEMEGKNVIIGPGCVADPHASEENLLAVRRAVETWKPKT